MLNKNDPLNCTGNTKLRDVDLDILGVGYIPSPVKMFDSNWDINVSSANKT